MKIYKSLVFIVLTLIFISCGSNRKEKESFFSFDDSTIKPLYQAYEKIGLSVLNTKNKTIDSITYFVNNQKITTVKGNGKFTFDGINKKLGYQNVKALIYFEGDTISTKTRVEIASGIAPKLLKYTIVNTYTHDVDAFTEGLEFYRDTLMESTGQNGKSYFAKIDYKTGKSFKKVSMDKTYFGEGITVINNKIYQLTWESATGFIYDANTLKKLKTFTYDKKIEGWGMTNDGKNIYQSDGTEKIWTMNPDTQKMVDFINVYSNDNKIKSINELEWVDGNIYANIWQKDIVVKVDPKTGAVEAVLDLSGLRAKVTNKEAEVLNGIAYNKKTQTFFVTGKNWNKTFELKITN